MRADLLVSQVEAAAEAYRRKLAQGGKALLRNAKPGKGRAGDLPGLPRAEKLLLEARAMRRRYTELGIELQDYLPRGWQKRD